MRTYKNIPSSDIERKLVLLTQEGLPLVKQPYLELAKQLGVSESRVIKLFESMLGNGKVRRIAAVPNHYKLGYIANGMSVWNVPDEKINTLGQQVGALDFVSHCYERPRHGVSWPYNLFAMVHAKSHDEAMVKVEKISQLLGENNLGNDVLFSTRILKKQGLRLIKTDKQPVESSMTSKKGVITYV